LERAICVEAMQPEIRSAVWIQSASLPPWAFGPWFA
jgi:hypothetical protein